jgi:glycosyltransferase involved in cell wall biosynthesis
VLQRALARLRRAWAGAPKYYRPRDSELRGRRGVIDAMMRDAVAAVVAEAAESIEAARRDRADVLFTHDPAVADWMLSTRDAHQQVWLMVHTPMPIALYLTWSWGVPERDWREVVTFPDVQAWIDWELALWSRVDRIVIPCDEAIDELQRVDHRARETLGGRTSFVLTGASGGVSSGLSIGDLRRRFALPLDQRIGLYLGNRQPYRGLDALIDAVRLREGPGLVAIAGPPADSLPPHPRLRPLGPVSDVRALLEAVDFAINVNRFSLFDLSTIEACEAGKPLLLHATGGNRTFRDLGCGVDMFADLEPATIAEGLGRMYSMSAERLRELGAASRACYERHLTPEHCWSQHQTLYEGASVRHARVAIG